MTGTESIESPIERLEARFAAQEHRIAALEAELRQLRARPEPPSVVSADAPSVVDTPAGGAVDRRSALKKGLGLAGAAAAGAVLVDAAPAAAANGDPMILGTVNVATTDTDLVCEGNLFNGFTVETRGGESTVAAIRAVGDGCGGLEAIGTTFNLKCSTPNFAPTFGRNEPWRDQFGHAEGEIVAAEGATSLWYCIQSGIPGTWRKLAGIGTAGAFHLLPTPVRVYDSRPGTLPSQGPKTQLPAGNIARTIDLKLNNSGVPAGATGALVTVLLVNAAAGQGNFTMWANDKPKPLSNTMVWGGDAGRFTSVATTALSPHALVKVDASLPTNLVLDVIGYYR